VELEVIGLSVSKPGSELSQSTYIVVSDDGHVDLILGQEFVLVASSDDQRYACVIDEDEVLNLRTGPSRARRYFLH
jgi:hypothetical protein